MVELRFTPLAGDEADGRLLVVGPSLGTGVADLWSRCVELLPPTVQVVGWDLPGHGGSSPAHVGFSVIDLAARVRDRTTSLASGRPATYAGVSLGGAVGFVLAVHPGPFDAVVTLASAPRLGTPGAWHERAALVRRAGTSALMEGSAVRWFSPGFAEREPSTAGALLDALGEVDDSSYAWACEALAGYDVRHTLSEVAVPLLVAGGAHDAVVPPHDLAVTAAATPGSRLAVLDGVAHLPPAEEPTATAALISSFLTDPRNQEQP